jgi:hypothetical protein
MTMQINWNQTIQNTPGLYINDQQPEGCGMAVTIERLEPEWTVRYIFESGAQLMIKQYSAASAFDVYRLLDQLFKQSGYVPQLTEPERETLHLPERGNIFDKRLSRQLPGQWIGAPKGAESDGEWKTNYSIEIKPLGKFILYTGIVAEDEDFLAEPQIDPSGPFDLSEMLDELRILGFSINEYGFLLQLSFEHLQEIYDYLPGYIIKNPAVDSPVKAISVCSCGDEWKVFLAQTEQAGQCIVYEQPDLDAKRVHKIVHDSVGLVVPGEIRDQLRLPSLYKLYQPTLNKKMKGLYIGAVSGQDDNGLTQERYVSVKRENDDEWQIHYAKSEDLTSGNRKIHVESIGPFSHSEFVDIALNLDPIIDPLDMVQKMSESSEDDISNLAKLFMEEME